MSRHSPDIPLESLGRLNATSAAINATATATADQIATGYITTVSASAVTITLPTGTLLGARLGAQRGTVFDCIFDNTGGTSSGIVTIAVATNGIQSTMDLEITAATASVTPSTVTPLTIPIGVTGVHRYTFVFSSATAYTFTRTA